ncbi:MAG: Spx/MgsR family RNA polymerase-binding regulatory protein [Pseudomonadota bacterium]
MALTFWGLKSCDTCKKAQKALEAAGVEMTVKDVRADGVDEATIAGWLAVVGGDALVNRRSTTWRGLSDAEKAAADGDEAAALLAANPTLIKRPVIVTGDAVHVGWTKDAQAALL